MRINLDVPFRERDSAKNMGARWDPSFPRANGRAGCWHIDDANPRAEEALRKWGRLDAAPEQTAIPPAVAPEVATNSDRPASGANAAASLAEFLDRIRKTVEERFSELYWVKAELSEIKTAANGHVYMTLVETANGQQSARVSAMVWSRVKDRCFGPLVAAIGAMPVAGMTLMVRCKPVFSVKYGLSVEVVEIDPSATLGAMELRLRQLRSKLKTLDLYDANRRLEMPRDFNRIAVVAPAGAAGLQDFQRETAPFHRNGVCEFIDYPATFQGEKAGESVSAALLRVAADHAHMRFDAAIVIRGGGAVADLAWLNDERIAMALARMPIPVITGLGHEKDDTILDEIACIRAGTPSKAAYYVTSRIVGNAVTAQDDAVAIGRIADKLLAGAERDITVSIADIAGKAGACVDRAEAEIGEKIRAMPMLAEIAIDKAQKSISALAMETAARADAAAAKAGADFERALETSFAAGLRLLEIAEANAGKLKDEVLTMGPATTMRRGYAIVRHGATAISNVAAAREAGADLTITFKDGDIAVAIRN